MSQFVTYSSMATGDDIKAPVLVLSFLYNSLSRLEPHNTADGGQLVMPLLGDPPKDRVFLSDDMQPLSLQRRDYYTSSHNTTN